MAARIRKGDTVVVIAGVSKGRRGEVLRMMPKADRAVSAISDSRRMAASRRASLRASASRAAEDCSRAARQATRHIKPRGVQEPGGVRQQEAAIHLSNLMLIDPRSEKPTKVGFRVLDDGRKVRVAKATGEVIES